jgi:peptide/nickel transport system permease protein
MLVFVIRRSMQSVVVLLVMSLLVFVGVFAIGNPIDILINRRRIRSSASRRSRHWVWTSRCTLSTSRS